LAVVNASAPVTIHSVPAPDDALREQVNAILRDFNRDANPDFWATLDDPAKAAQPINLFAFVDGRVIGGLFGETRLAWLKVSILAVAFEHRRKGTASRLMAEAEREAVRRGCRYAYIDTMDYQSPRLYAKLGYKVACTLEDWDSHGHAKYFFTKTLIGE